MIESLHRAWHWFYTLPDRAFRTPALVLLVVLALMVLMLDGCASMDLEWTQKHAAAPKPWHYITVANVDRACRAVGARTMEGDRILGCAVWLAYACAIYLPPNAPAWIVRHEERHCEGWTHD